MGERVGLLFLALSSSAVRTDILSAVCDLKGDSFLLGKLLILLLQLELQSELPLAMALIVHKHILTYLYISNTCYIEYIHTYTEWAVYAW